MNSAIEIKDKINIFCRTGIKVVRGCFKQLFLKEAQGMLLVGKGVQITHGKHIRRGRNVKFEYFSKIHRLCFNGLKFRDYVTISRDIMVDRIGLMIANYSSISLYEYMVLRKNYYWQNVRFEPKHSLLTQNCVFSDMRCSIKS